MTNFLNLLLYKYRRFKGQTYLKNSFPRVLLVSAGISIFLSESYFDFYFLILFFTLIDIILSIAAWFYYSSDL